MIERALRDIIIISTKTEKGIRKRAIYSSAQVSISQLRSFSLRNTGFWVTPISSPE
ncbi:hypothetical protein [Methanothermobacter sp.]|uniref:hypothetical protein n=1 Tax=Methanothermobacter sp. TaxID=1884223 RepID=UPI002602F723|nr:hypothetical protein [Methanothermobacter sp.]MDI9618760.1 hypothetical protein [Methanothermobacter sp.]